MSALSFPCLREEALQRAGVQTGIQPFHEYRFLLEFIPLKNGAGMTKWGLCIRI
jgi:hypothetical protein